MDNQFGTVHGCELFCSRIRTTVIILVNVAIHCYGNALSIWYYKLCTKDLVLGNLHFCIIDRVASLGVKYSPTQNVVILKAQYFPRSKSNFSHFCIVTRNFLNSVHKH